MASNNAHVKSDGPIDPDSHGQETLRDDNGPEDVYDDASAAPAQQKKPSRFGFAAITAKLGLNAGVLIPMIKGSLPPIIGIAMCQSQPVAEYFTTLGYLIPIISVLGLAMLPRGKFLQNLVLNVFAICFGSAVAMLALWSSIKARENTTPAGESLIDPATGTVRYNSSQSAVLAVWLFANIWFVNVLRAKFPAFAVPVILYSILVNVASTFGTRMPTVVYAEKFIQELITAMLTGLALATGVSLVIVPISSRMVVFKEFAGSIGLLRQAMGLQKKYLVGLEELDMFAVVTHQATMDARAAEKKKKKSKKAKEAGWEPDKQPSMTKEAAIAKELKAAIAQVREMAGKIQADIAFAKRDVAWGKLDAKDLGEIAKLLRNATIPVVGISSIMDIFNRVAERRGWNVDADEEPEIVAQKDREKRVWNEVMKRMHMPFEILSQAVDQGLEHAAMRLEILPKPKADKKAPKDADIEAKGDSIKPGDDGFSDVIRQKLEQFAATKGEALRTWVKERAVVRGYNGLSSAETRERDQAQLYCLLYMERLMHASGEAMLDLVVFADKKVEDGTMSRNRLIFPTQRRLRKWLVSIFREEDSSAEQSPDVLETGISVVYVGDGYNRKKDPEHLPPTSAWQRAGNVLRKVSAFFASEECAFGFRVAAATMTIGIIAFLESTQAFFVAQRLVWAMIMIAIGMTMTSGQSIFGFFCRVGGTVIAMVCSLIVWYIVNEKTPGVIVFLWFSIFCDFYFLIKFPRFTPAVMITIVTQCLIIGYELQVRKLGPQAAASSGQPVFPTYKLAPYRLATVAAGCFVAFIWTVFPSPLTDRTWLRRDLSAALYLLANYYGVITSTVKSQIEGTAGNPDLPHSPAHELQKIRRKIFGKMMLLLPSMTAHAAWQKWEPTIGGRFPREAYEDIITRTTRIMSYLTFMSYTMNHPPTAHLDAFRARREAAAASVSTPAKQQQPRHPSESSSSSAQEATPITTTDGPSDRDWLESLAQVLREISPSHHNITSTLMLLSNSLFSGHSMPPFLPLPRPYEMTRALLRLDRRVDPAAAAAAVSPSEEEEADLSPLMVVNSRTGHAVDEPRGGRRRSGAEGSAGLGGLGLGLMDREHVLDPANVEKPGYAEFAVLEICSTLVCDDLEGLIRSISGLVGVVDFSYRVDRSEGSLGSGGEAGGKGKID
ncbi:hypothetical protein CONLIGDRAFT_150020 [Coniochaeta ligniaria NRRL 30616]|uniref:ER transporter 6TM N-terminal domain-containing protein n=1 Tax=Coniochaeta ligniaria NRRL 30616 TaxID=1408157 RepID=A0A1J7J5M3_9PEZI|nr:hypothetical protein CONLIGDRAFT_150020 [Coniochaeta ligniaria NRRL 30616]